MQQRLLCLKIGFEFGIELFDFIDKRLHIFPLNIFQQFQRKLQGRQSQAIRHRVSGRRIVRAVSHIPVRNVRSRLPHILLILSFAGVSKMFVKYFQLYGKFGFVHFYSFSKAMHLSTSFTN